MDLFTHFLSDLPGLLSFYTPLQHTKILGVGLGVVLPGLGVVSRGGGGRGCINPWVVLF